MQVIGNSMLRVAGGSPLDRFVSPLTKGSTNTHYSVILPDYLETA